MQRLVGIGRRVFDHHEGGILACLLVPEGLIGTDLIEVFDPNRRSDTEVEEALDDLNACYQRAMLQKVGT